MPAPENPSVERPEARPTAATPGRVLRRERHALAVLFLVYLLLLLARARVWNGTGTDEVFYYAQLTSPLWDRDVEISNDVAESRNEVRKRMEMAEGLYFSGRQTFGFPCGVSFLNTPVAAVLYGIDAATGFALSRGNRYAYFHRVAPTLTVWIFGLLGLGACQRIARRWVDPWTATALALALFLGTNVCYYVWVNPGMTHVHSFALGALMLWGAIRYPERPTRARALFLGVVVGLAFLVRSESAIGIVLILACWGSAFRTGQSVGRTEGIRHLVIAGAAAFLFALPQFLQWIRIHGSWVAIPQGEQYLVWSADRIGKVLFSPLNGWIVSHPLVALGLVGLPFLFRRSLWLAGSIALVLFLDVAINSLPQDWWGSGTFGGRRFTAMLPLLVPCLALLFGPGASGAWRIVQRGLAGFLFLCVLLNMLLVIRYTFEGPVPGWFFFGGGDWVRLLSLPFRHAHHVVASDLFVPPVHSDRPVEIYGTFLVAWGVSAGTAAAVLGLGWVRRTVVGWERALAAAVAVGAALLFLGLSWLALPQPQGEALGLWGGRALALRVSAEEEHFGTEAIEFLRDHPDVPLVQLRLLHQSLVAARYEQADELSRALQDNFCASSAEMWLLAPADSSTYRAMWVRKALMERDPSDEFLKGLHRELCAHGDSEWAKALDARLGGASWERRLRRADREWQAGRKVRSWTALLVQALEANPYGIDAAVAPLPWLERQSPEARRLRALIVSVTAPRISLARYVAASEPQIVQHLKGIWYGALVQRAKAFESAGHLADLEANLTLSRSVITNSKFLRGLEHQHEIAERFQCRASGKKNCAYPDGESRWADPPFPAEAVATCSPQWLRTDEGWGSLEGDETKNLPWRWSVSRNTLVRMEGKLVPGDYSLHIEGLRHGPWGEPFPGAVEVIGQRQVLRFDIPAAEFHLRIPIRIDQETECPTFRVFTPTVPARRVDPKSRDPRWVGFLCSKVWLTR